MKMLSQDIRIYCHRSSLHGNVESEYLGYIVTGYLYMEMLSQDI